MAVLYEGLVILDGTVAVRPLYQGAEELGRRFKIGITAGDDLDVLSFCARA